MQKYVWYNDGPEHEFLDIELERKRSALKGEILEFAHLAGLYTSATYRGEDDEMRKIPDQYVDGKYSDRPFFQKAREINKAAEVVYKAFNVLVRQARLKFALSEPMDARE